MIVIHFIRNYFENLIFSLMVLNLAKKIDYQPTNGTDPIGPCPLRGGPNDGKYENFYDWQTAG